jgi:hypothetical protein
MPNNRITIQIEGTGPGGNVQLQDFLRELDSIRLALIHTEHLVSGRSERTVTYQVVDLSHNSPATIVIEANPIETVRRKRDYSHATLRNFVSSINTIRRTGRLPARVDTATLESYKALGAKDSGTSRMLIRNAGKEVQIDETFRKKIDKITPPDEHALGTMTGMLEAVNLHNASTFNLYPIIGPTRVTCTFKASMRHQVIAALDHHVTVQGQLNYKFKDRFPYSIDVQSIEVLPDEADLPTLYEARGIAPDITGDESSSDFINRIRDGWD